MFYVTRNTSEAGFDEAYEVGGFASLFEARMAKDAEQDAHPDDYVYVVDGSTDEVVEDWH